MRSAQRSSSYIAETQGSQADEKLLTAVAGGMPPLYYADRFTVPQFAHQGFFSDITAQAEAAGVTSDQYFDFAWNEATYKGGVYALPLDTDTRALWYNKGNVEEVGLDPEAPPTTTDELRTITEALTVRNASGAITRYGINPLYDQAWLYTWGFAFRGEFQDPETKRITFAHPNNIAAMEFIKVFVEEIGVEDGRHAGGLLWRRLRRPERLSSGLAKQPWSAAATGRLPSRSATSRHRLRRRTHARPGRPRAARKLGLRLGGASPKAADDVATAFDALYFLCGPVGQEKYNKDTYHIPTVSQSPRIPTSLRTRCTPSSWMFCRYPTHARRSPSGSSCGTCRCEPSATSSAWPQDP